MIPRFNSDLSDAVVIFLAFGSASSPRQDRDGLARKFGLEKGVQLASQVAALVSEMNSVAIDWSAHTLDSAGAMVRKEMQNRHPDLSESALAALAWKFTFDWR
jgi:hypothetical protein